MSDRPNRARIVAQATIALSVALLGFLLATQLRVQEGLEERLAVESESDLVRILSDLSTRSDQLLEDIVDLRIRLADAAGSSERTDVLIASARSELEAIEILLGAVPVTGSGIRLVIEDPESVLGPESILDVIQELRDAGAEAVEIDRIRVVASTAVTGRPGVIRVAGEATRAPYIIVAVGAPETMAEAMRIPGGIVDSISAKSGATVRIDTLRRARIESLQRPPEFSYARPSERGSRDRGEPPPSRR